jgi:hypothetical protein
MITFFGILFSFWLFNYEVRKRNKLKDKNT